MQQTFTLGDKAKQLAIILVPILITQLSLTATGFFDTVMSGRAGYYDLAGVATGTNLWMPVYTGLTGLLLGVTPILSQLNGAGRRRDMAGIVFQGLYLSAALTLVVILAGWAFLEPVLRLMDLEDEVRRITQGFLQALSLGFLPLFFTAVLRNFIDSLGYTRITMLITLCTVPVNVLLNYLLILGEWGFPRLGGVGAGYASALTYWLMCFCAVGVVCLREPFKSCHIFSSLPSLSLPVWRELLKVGVPIGASIFCEVSIFGAVGIWMTGFGTATIAAHQSAINFAGLIYMIPLSIGMALTIVTGFEAGARRPQDARQYAWLGIGISVAIAVLTGWGLWLLKPQVAALYITDNQAVLDLTRSFLTYAVFFQLADAIAAPIQGVLRGYKDVTVTLVVAIVAYWVIGAPVGYGLAKYSSFGPYGYWIGLIAGLTTGAAVLLLRLLWLQKRMTERRELK